jgi:hypothetical protein
VPQGAAAARDAELAKLAAPFVDAFPAGTMKSQVTLPLGSGAIGDFSADWSTLRAPSDIWAVEVQTGKASRLRSEARPSLPDLAPIQVSIAEVKAFDGQTLPINVYFPARAPDKTLSPAGPTNSPSSPAPRASSSGSCVRLT